MLAQDDATPFPVGAAAAGCGGGRGAAPARSVVRETLDLAIGQKLQGVRLGGGLTDHHMRTDDGRVHLLRRVSGTPEKGVWREVTSSVDWPTYNGDYSGNRYTTMTKITKVNVASLWKMRQKEETTQETIA